MTCLICNQTQFEVIERVYVRQNGNCRVCDTKKWKAGGMAQDEYERRWGTARNGAGEK